VIAVVCAVPAERRALAGLAGASLSVEAGGMGPEAAGRAGTRVAAGRPRAMVAAGFCGALSKDLRVGDLVAGAEVCDDESGESFAADPALLAAAPGRRGVIVSVRRLARTPEDRARLDGLAVDMESAALARAAARAGVPFLALRAVTDETRHRLPDFDAMMDAAGRLTPGAGILYFLLHPGQIRSLMRLGPASRRAGRSLRNGVGELARAVA
jgi:adenosylhomocysteine nucleosidase